MILYNITTKVDWSVHDEWLEWMKEKSIPDLVDTFFFDFKMLRLLHIDDTDGPTYAVQYFTESIALYKKFVVIQLNIHSQKESNKWGNNVISFSTVMEVVY